MLWLLPAGVVGYERFCAAAADCCRSLLPALWCCCCLWCCCWSSRGFGMLRVLNVLQTKTLSLSFVESSLTNHYYNYCITYLLGSILCLRENPKAFYYSFALCWLAINYEVKTFVSWLGNPEKYWGGNFALLRSVFYQLRDQVYLQLCWLLRYFMIFIYQTIRIVDGLRKV